MALAPNPYAQYKKQAVTTAKPEQLLIMLFDGAIRFVGQARKTIEDKDIEKTNTHLMRSQDIVYELIGSLNMDFDISHSLLPLYEYINHNLQQANISKDVKYLDIAESLLREFREVWIEAGKLAKNPAMTLHGGDGVEKE